VTVIWDFQGNWSISTSLTFPISFGGGVIHGYQTTGREIIDALGP